MSKSPVPAEGSYHFQSKTGSYHYVKKTGYLVKSPSNGRIGRWRKRWFMLVDSVEPGILTGTPERQIRLEYYDVAPLKMRNLRELPKRKGMIDLRPCIAIVANEDKIKGHKNIINIVMSSFRVHHLVAESLEERDEWVLALTEFVFSKTKEAQNYFTRTRLKQSVYTDFLTSSYYFRSKDDQFLSSHAMRDGAALPQHNTGSDGEGPPPILEPRCQFSGGRSSLQRAFSHRPNASEGMDKVKRKSLARGCSMHENPETTDGLLQIQLSNWNMTMISRSNILLGETITTNCLKKTSHGTWLTGTGEKQPVIIKTALKDPKLIMKEGLTLWQMMHPNIVMLVGAVLIDTPKHIILEYCEKGTLLNVLHDHGRHLESGSVKSSTLKSTLLKYCKQTSLGLSYLKDKEIVHGAIKASNILVSNEDTCKISGFGESLSLKDGSHHQLNPDYVVSVEWIAPEAYTHKICTAPNDIWCLGVVLYEIWSLGYQPYQGMAKEEIIPRLKDNYRLPPPPGVSKDIYRLMIELWHPNPEKRPKIESLVTFLVQPEEDLLHMNQLPKKSSQKAHSAHTLGAPISSGELLYRDLQLTYVEFIEEAVEGKNLAAENACCNRQSSVSCSYIEIGDIQRPAITLKKFATANRVLKEHEDDLYWNDPNWKDLALSLQDSEASASQPSSPELTPKDDESDIYWNDPVLPPLTMNSPANSRKEEEAAGSKGDESHGMSFKAPLHKVHTQALNKLWNASNMSSSEDESQHLASKVKKKRALSKKVCANRLPLFSGSHNSSVNSSDSDSNTHPQNICDPENLAEKLSLSNKSMCSSVHVSPTKERDQAEGYYNASALEVLEQLSKSTEVLHLAGIHHSPLSGLSHSQAKSSSRCPSAPCVVYANLEELKADIHSSNPSKTPEDVHNYYNSSAVVLETASSGADTLEPHSKDVTEYYNSSATVISLPASEEGRDKEYYNSDAVMPTAKTDQQEEEDEVSNEYYNSSSLPFESSSSADRSGQGTEPLSGYYNSSAVEIFGGSLGRNPENVYDHKSDRSKSSYPKYVNLEFFDSDDDEANPPSTSENSNSQNCKEQEAVTSFESHTYSNLLDSTSAPNGVENLKSYELEESCIREDICELLKARSQKINAQLHVSSTTDEGPFRTYYNITTASSREVGAANVPAHPQAIVHITPPYDPVSGKQKKPKPTVRYVKDKRSKRASIEDIQKTVDEKQSSDENQSGSQSRYVNASMVEELTESLKNNSVAPAFSETSSTLTSSLVADGRDNHSKTENFADHKMEVNGNKPVPKKKQVQIGHRYNQSSGTSSPSKRSHQTSTFNQNRIPKEGPETSPSASPTVSPTRRSEMPSNFTLQAAHEKASPENDMIVKPNGVNQVRKNGKQVQEASPRVKTEQTVSGTDKHPVSSQAFEEGKTIEKASSAIELVKRVTSEPNDSRCAIKATLTKVLSNSHVAPSSKKRPSPPPKSAAVINAISRGPPVAKKPILFGSSSLSNLGTSTAATAAGNLSNSKSSTTDEQTKLGSNHMDRTPVATPSQVSKTFEQHKTLHKTSSDTSSSAWQKQAKKPLLPPSRGNSSSSKDSGISTQVKSRYIST